MTKFTCILATTTTEEDDNLIEYRIANDEDVLYSLPLDDMIKIDTASINATMALFLKTNCTEAQAVECLNRLVKQQTRHSTKLRDMQIKIDNQTASSSSHIGDAAMKFEKETKKLINEISKLQQDIVKQEAAASKFLSEQLATAHATFEKERKNLTNVVSEKAEDLRIALGKIVDVDKIRKDIKAEMKSAKKWFWF